MSNPKNAVVWFEIPVSNLSEGKKFYETVLQSTMIEDSTGPNPILFFPIEDMKTGISGHLYAGTPGNGNGSTIHLDVPTPLEKSLKRLVAAGGKIVSDEVKVPDGRFVYCQDPDGNSLGLFNRN